MENLDIWVADELQRLIGISDIVVVDYFIALAKKTKTPEDYINSLQKIYDIDAATTSFVNQLWSKFPHQSEQMKPARIKEEQARQEQIKNKSYKLIPDEDDDDEYEPSSKRAKTEGGKASKSLRKPLSESEDDVVPAKAQTAKEQPRDRNDDDDIDKDIKNRDGYVKRLIERDAKSNQRKSKSNNISLEESANKVRLEAEEMKKQIPNIRKKSRWTYLDKRQTEKLILLEEGLIEEKNIFKNEKLTEGEKKIYERKEKILSIAKDISKGKQIENKDRYVEDKNISSQTVWEEQHLNAGIIHFGAQDAKDKSNVKEYDYVLDDEIEFVQLLTMPGTKNDLIETVDPEVERRKTIEEGIEEIRKSLPIYAFKEELKAAIKAHQVLIIEGETGSGKTTQLPQYLYEAGYTENGRKIGCTQPRRVAAMSVAARVSVEMKVKLGNEVGYNIRFENNTQESTVIKYMTDGMLLKEFLTDPLLEGYSVMIIDEAHERSLHTDILFGLVKDIARYRKDLKVLIASATLNTDKFSEFFDNAPVFKIPGRTHPVDVYFAKNPEHDYVAATIASVLQIHATQPLGDILVFLTGQEEIETVNESLMERIRQIGPSLKELIILQIYSHLPTDMQAKIFAKTPEGARKVILATNIAETSLTIDGIVYVIDAGYCKLKNCDPRTGIESLTVTPISQAMAAQRAGRAGRVRPGKCFRLYTKSAFTDEMDENIVPEIQRTNLANVILLLKSLGVGSQQFNDILHFDFMDPPHHESMINALGHLYALGALNKRGELTTVGRKMAELPLEPMMSSMIIASEKYKCTTEILTIAAMLDSSSSLFYRPKEKKIHADSAHKNFICQPEPIGDHMMLLNIYQAWAESGYSQQWCYENYIQFRQMNRARDVRDQLERMLERIEITPVSSSDSAAIRKAITAGFFYNLAKYTKGGEYQTILHKQRAEIHPSSCMSIVELTQKEKEERHYKVEEAPKKKRPKWVIYNELVLTSREYMRLVLEIEQEWILEVAPAYYKEKQMGEQPKNKMPKNTGKSSYALHGK